MHSQARLWEAPQPDLRYGEVVGRCGQDFWVETGLGRLRAGRALGCLVLPRLGDRVLLSADAAGECWVLSVLSRGEAGESGTDLLFEGPVNLRVEGGLTIAAREELAWTANKITVSAHEAEASVGKVSFLGQTLEAQFEWIKAVAVRVDQVFERLTQRLFESLRFVREHEEVQTGSTRLLVEDTFTVQARNAVHQAEEIYKIDAGQVHLG
ncbi:MAG: DUF3540 domain-containing protein [Thermodesulfobacteriota bacterium]